MGETGTIRQGARAAIALGRYSAVMATLAAAYVTTGRLGLLLAQHQDNATLVWAPTGISLAALVLHGRRVWPAVFAGALAVNLWVDTPPGVAMGIATGNTLEAVVGSYLLERLVHLKPELARLRDVLGFLLYGAAVCTLISATCGVLSLYAAGALPAEALVTVWLDWWLGDAGGAIVFAPLVFVGFRGQPEWGPLARRAETWLVLGLIVWTGVAGFGGFVPSPWRLLLSFLPFPFLVWAGLRLGPRGAVIASVLTSVIVVAGSAMGTGPFHGEADLYITWAYMTTMGMAAVILAAAVAEREDADRARRKEEQQRERLEAQLRHTQRLESLGILAGGVAHDYNNLLVPIRTNAELLKNDLGAESESSQLVGEIETAAVRAAELCQQLLTYAGHTEPAMTRVDLEELAREMETLLSTTMSRKVRVIDRFGPNVPPVSGDGSQIRQVIMNLMINASEAMGEHAGEIRITTSVEHFDAEFLRESFLHSDAPTGRYVVLEVADNGAGMDPETLERMFDPFFSTKFTGRGLGMAAVLGIVRAHNGAIKVHTQPGRGSTFRVLLPSWEREVEPASNRGALLATGTGAVLVADDEPSVLRTVRRVLERAGYRVHVVSDGGAAVEYFRRHPGEVDVVLLDMMMPVLGGADALLGMRRIRPDLPAVLMSGYDEASLERGRPENARFVHKPFDTQDLLSALAYAAQNRLRYSGHAPRAFDNAATRKAISSRARS